MTKKIQFVGTTVARIIDTTPSTVRRLEPDEVAKALGAEPCAEKLPSHLGPITRYAVRLELFRRLQSQGGRPGLVGNNLRTKIPLSDQDWHHLEELARQLAAETGLSPSPGQIGSVLLSMALRAMTAEPGEKSGSIPTTALVNELAARAPQT
jgi:hypothetical protein